VYGLRRALVVAGAQTLVTSLWKVDDQVTRDLMVAYYKNLLGGAGRVEALRRAALLIRKTHPEPRFWAPFIAIGQNGPLKGIRGVE
jgi:CHAT domain-containing protein